MSTFWLSLFRPILNFGSFKLIQTVLSTFGVIRAHLGSLSLLGSSAYNFTKKISNVTIFVLWLSSSSYFGNSVRYINVNLKFRCFSAYCSRSTALNKVDLILATQSKLLFEFNYLKSITEGLSFQIHLCQTQVKLLAVSSHTIVD